MGPFRQLSLLIITSALTYLSLCPRQVCAESPLPKTSQEELITKGELLYQTASCIGCHSWPQGNTEHLAGGRFAKSEYGDYYISNISPDLETGIGSWTEEDFFLALRQGLSPTGKRYWPTFPYQAYTKLSDEDIRALWAYLQSQPAVSSPNGEHDIKFPYNIPGLIRLWRGLFFEAGAFEADPNKSDSWNRGAYISAAMGYCTVCHTPRNAIGKSDMDRYLGGGVNPGKDIFEVSPNLTPDKQYGLGTWTEQDIIDFLSTGLKPDGSSTDHIMREKVDETTQHLSASDKKAVAEYLMSVPPIHSEPSTK